MTNGKEQLIGDYAFNVMDYLLHHADYRPGQLVLHHGRDVIYCYDLANLQRQLVQIAGRATKQKHGCLPEDLDDIAKNALEEYEEDLALAALPAQPGMRKAPMHHYGRRDMRMPPRYRAKAG